LIRPPRCGWAPLERIYPIHALGSRTIQVTAGIDDIIEHLRGLAGQDGVYVASTTRASNPVQAEAAKTIAYEIFATINRVPDWMIVPTGGGGTIAGIATGFEDLVRIGVTATRPRLAAVVPRRYDALRVAFEREIEDESFRALRYSDDVPTVLTKLSHGHPPDGLEALKALRASNGRVVAVEEDPAIHAVARIGAADGLYVEPSSAVALLAVEELVRRNDVARGQHVVALACGSGFGRPSFYDNRCRFI
jgi:threonine synthase